MALPRSRYVHEGQEGVYHCFSRCVRRAFLYGFDAVTGRDFSHRKAWLVDRLRHLAAVFAIEVCAYAVMLNHWHAILRTRPDIVATWTDREVATRWLTLFPRHRNVDGSANPPTEEDICVLTGCPERIAVLRRRLCSLSWFMGRMNEFMARAANREDEVKGRFWEGRFKCQALLDDVAIVGCMVYVDLNPIRAGQAATPEGSDFTSIQERIRAWQRERMATASGEGAGALGTGSVGMEMEEAGEIRRADAASDTERSDCADGAAVTADWLCPIESGLGRRGILQMSAAEYFELVDRSGRLLRSDKRGGIDAELAPILVRIGARPEAWLDTISQFGSRFRLAAGLISSLRDFADQIGNRWLKGIGAARAAFAPPLPQSA